MAGGSLSIGDRVMGRTVADVLLARLREWGVRQVFGYPGDGINGLPAAWGRAEDDPQSVQARHEQRAASVAVGFAQFSGGFGVCAATSSPTDLLGAGAAKALLGKDVLPDSLPWVTTPGRRRTRGHRRCIEGVASPGHGMTLSTRSEQWCVPA
jgi:thiamine pyrophosphate-dependent acetolactate synthase large subunit-like protein